jgi:KDO2-lipid IV(A) lauroyltransferase
MWLQARLPWRLQMALGAALGMVLYGCVPSRRHVVLTNLARVFPELPAAERRALARAVFRETAKALPETCVAWFGGLDRLNARWQVEGLEHLQTAAADPQGVLLVGAHFSCLDVCGAYLGQFIPYVSLQRKHNNPLMNWFQNRGRRRYVTDLIDRDDMRTMVKQLRQGELIFYAPDQDFGRRHSQFVPFFGIQTATVEATSRLLTLGRARALLISGGRTQHGYHMRIEPAPQLAQGDVYSDLVAYHQWLEHRILADPSQYLWLHRRFKTRPDGEASFYGRSINPDL